VPARPRLKPHLRILRRGPHTLQLGLERPGGLVLDGVSEAEAAWVKGLDGTRTLGRSIAEAAAHGIPVVRARHLLALLRSNGALVEAPASRWHFATLGSQPPRSLAPDADALAASDTAPSDGFGVLAARARRDVVVAGSGRLAAEICSLLRLAGARAALIGPYAGGPAGVPAGPDRDPNPALAVVVGALPLDAAVAADWHAAGVAHLPVAVGTATALVGPVVHPGSTACLRCMDLTRADLDPGWPALLAQALPAAVGPVAEVDAETSLLAVTASVTAMAALTVLDGRDGATGLSLEISLPWPEITQRRWLPHPDCACGAWGGGGREADKLDTRAS
jgi:bacteriocin biosynthesis cyclodehydratase domain-containing protein